MRRLMVLVGMLACLPAAAEKVQDQTVMIQSEDPDMLAAMRKAQSSLGDFLRVAAHPPAGASGFKLKVKVTDAHGSEHMWVEPFRATRTGFAGTLTNEPDLVTNVRYGQEIVFTKQDISDWGYVQDGKQKGGFTVCVMFKHLPPAEVEMYRRDYGFEC